MRTVGGESRVDVLRAEAGYDGTMMLFLEPLVAARRR